MGEGCVCRGGELGGVSLWCKGACLLCIIS